MELQITDPRYEVLAVPIGGSDQLTGSIYKVLPPINRVINAGEWNHYKIDPAWSSTQGVAERDSIQDVNLDTVNQKIVPHEDWKEEGAAAFPNARAADTSASRSSVSLVNS